MADPLSETDLPYRLGDKEIVDSHGHAIAPEMCLVSITPGEGWDVTVSVKGVQAPVSGPTPQHIVAILAERLETNGIHGVPLKDLWVNLNVIWMGRVNPRHHRVFMSDMLEALSAVDSKLPEGATQIRHKVDQWGDLAWGVLELYLCRENYQWFTFNSLVGEVAAVFDPALTPTLGDGRLNLLMATELRNLRMDPVYDRVDAREWLKITRSKVMGEIYEGSPLWVR